MLDMDVSLRILTLALSHHPYNIKILFNIASILAIQGKPVKSIIILQKLHKARPDSLEIIYNLIFTQLQDQWWYKDAYALQSSFNYVRTNLFEHDKQTGLFQKIELMMEFCLEKKLMQERLNIDLLDGVRHIKPKKFNDDRCKVNELKKLELLNHR